MIPAASPDRDGMLSASGWDEPRRRIWTGIERRRHRLAVTAVALMTIATGCTAADPITNTTLGRPGADTDLNATDQSAPDATVAPQVARTAMSNIDSIVRWHLSAQDLAGASLVIVDRDRGIVDERYWGEFGPTRVSLVASSSKMITATVLLGLHGDGILDIDQPIAELVEWAPDFDDIVVADLLSSTSGLVGLAPNPLYPPYLCQLEFVDELVWCGIKIANTADDDADVAPPRTDFRYGGAQWQLAGALAVAVSGMTWDELLDRYLRVPCEVGSLGYTNQWIAYGAGFSYPTESFDGDLADLPVTENPNMEGGAYINPVDYAKLLLLHLNGGRCGDAQPIPTDLIERSHRDRLAEVGVTLGPGRGYGLGWWVDLVDRSVTDPGAYGSYAWIDPVRGYGAFLMLEANGELAGDLFERIKPELVAMLDPSAPPATDPSPAVIDPPEVTDLTSAATTAPPAPTTQP